MNKLYLLKLSLLFLIALTTYRAKSQSTVSRYDIIPYPTKINTTQGNFVVNSRTKIVIPRASLIFTNEAKQLNYLVKTGIGNMLKYGTKRGTNTIQFVHNPALKTIGAYTL